MMQTVFFNKAFNCQLSIENKCRLYKLCTKTEMKYQICVLCCFHAVIFCKVVANDSQYKLKNCSLRIFSELRQCNNRPKQL